MGPWPWALCQAHMCFKDKDSSMVIDTLNKVKM
jgi:hypothetical protein